MAEHNDLGRLGEQLAHDFLIAKGYQILEQNWSCGHKEIDIIAMDGKELVIVEVKTRRVQCLVRRGAFALRAAVRRLRASRRHRRQPPHLRRGSASPAAGQPAGLR